MYRKLLSFAIAMLYGIAYLLPVSPAQAAQKIVIKVNAPYNPKSSGDMPLVTLVQAFQKEMESRFPDRVSVRIYWDQQLAKTYESALNALQTNVVHVTFFPLTTMAEFTPAGVPVSNLFLFPFPHTQIAYDAFDGEVGAMITERIIKDTRVRPIIYCEVGFRHLLNNKQAVTNLDSLKGLKFRVQPNPVHIASFRALGTNPTPISWSELFTSLQQGVVDGTENPFENIRTARLYEVQKYLTLSGHAFEMGLYAMGEEFYQSLPADIRDGMNEAMVGILAGYRKEMAVKDGEMLAFFKTKMQVNELSAAELERFRIAVEPALQLSRDQAGAEYADAIFALLKKYEDDYFSRTKK
jgi:tripartite ATP-independent transporter DctP family solute receptor